MKSSSLHEHFLDISRWVKIDWKIEQCCSTDNITFSFLGTCTLFLCINFNFSRRCPWSKKDKSEKLKLKFKISCHNASPNPKCNQSSLRKRRAFRENAVYTLLKQIVGYGCGWCCAVNKTVWTIWSIQGMQVSDLML